MAEETKGKRLDTPVREISIVLPAYNEEANVAAVVRDVARYVNERGLDAEILVVNDGSKDRTGEILSELEKEVPQLRPQNHPQNRGYGAALRTGFDAARSLTSSTWTATASFTSTISTSSCRSRARTGSSPAIASSAAIPSCDA